MLPNREALFGYGFLPEQFIYLQARVGIRLTMFTWLAFKNPRFVQAVANCRTSRRKRIKLFNSFKYFYFPVRHLVPKQAIRLRALAQILSKPIL